MKPELLVDTARRVADFEGVDWNAALDIAGDEDRPIVQQLAAVAQVAAAHRRLHDLLPVDTTKSVRNDLPLSTWGHLELLEEVGRGSFGIVYRALDTRLHREVALKLFQRGSKDSAVIDEGRRLARIRHPNVVTVFGADVYDGLPGIWMEFVRGKRLDALATEHGTFGAQETALIGRDLARALAAVHAAGIVHRDVKAQNVMREAGGRIVLMDLGASYGLSSHEAITEQIGTPLYMAPEVLAGGAATPQSDLYSLGITLFFLVTGQFPVHAGSIAELRRLHAAGLRRTLVDVRPDLPAPFVRTVSKAIEPSPDQRYQAAGAFEADLVEQQPHPEPPVRRLSFAARLWISAGAAALAVAALYLSLGLDRPTLSATGAPPANTVAVLPVVNLTGDPLKQYLADGMTELLITHLARLPGLIVTSSETMATQRGSRDDQRTLAKRLGVRLLLAGSVIQADSRIGLSVRLVDPYEGRTVWGSELERQPSTILSARSEIARLVAARLGLQLNPADASGAPERAMSPQSQDAFIRGVVELGSVSTARIAAAVANFERAVALEPAWAEPLAYLAYTQQLSLESGDPALRSQRAEVAKANAMRAIDLDPSLPISYTALAAVQAYHDWDFAAAETTLRQGLATSPRNGVPQSRLALLLAAAGRLDEAVAEAEAARDREPLVPERHTTLGIIRYYARDFDRAMNEMQQGLKVSAEYGPAFFGKGRILAALGRYDDAIQNVQLALGQAQNPGWLAFLGTAYAMAGRTGELRDVERSLRALEQTGTFVSIDNYAYNAAYEGRLDEAFALLDEAVRRRMTNVLWVAVDPRADPLRSDPRFDQLITRMGLVAR